MQTTLKIAAKLDMGEREIKDGVGGAKPSQRAALRRLLPWSRSSL